MFGRRGSEVARSENCSLKIMVSKLQQGVYSNYNYYNSHSKNNSTDYIHSYKKPDFDDDEREAARKRESSVCEKKSDKYR